jgi:leucyl aminopeptidase (aminopeptidase T)
MAVSFDLEKLLRDVFDPEPAERVLVMVDLPHGNLLDDPDWVERRRMAAEWIEGFRRLGADVRPLLSYPATPASNADLPETGAMEGKSARLADELASADIAVAMTRHSATAPLSVFIQRHPSLRVASMPGVLRRMEQTSLGADYREVARKAHILRDLLIGAESAEIAFSTGHTAVFDLRFRTPHADDGLCTREKKGFRLINLPSGEAFIVPYEGERPGEPSRTRGTIPVSRKGDLALLRVEENRIVNIEGSGPAASFLREHFAVDPARRNVAELGLGCNDRAVVTGSVLEDEKAGFHWAYGRSEHLGGTVGPSAFARPENVLHHDIVYAPGCPIEVRRLVLHKTSGAITVIENSCYRVF